VSEIAIIVVAFVVLMITGAFIVSLYAQDAPRQEWCRACGADIDGDGFYCATCQAARDRMLTAAQTAREHGLAEIRQRYAGTRTKEKAGL